MAVIKISRQQVPIWLFILVPLASTGVIAATLLTNGLNETGFQLAARYTVRISLPLFLLAYSASALKQLFPSEITRWLRRNRRYIGINFAIAHFIHMGAFIAFFIFIGEVPNLLTVLGGGSTYLLIAALALTSNNWSVHTLGKLWHWLHRVGIHAIWATFFALYLGRLSDPGLLSVGASGAGVLIFFAALRLVALASTRRKRAQTI